MIQSCYPLVTFDKILTKVDRRFPVEDAEDYRCLGLGWYGRGAYIREIKTGLEIKRKTQWFVETGDVLYNKLFAWKGAFALAGQDLDGCIVSDKFPTYRIDERLIRPEFLRFWFKTPQLANQARSLSKGAAAVSKLTLNPPDFWRLKIALPSLDEQDRLLAKLNTIMNRFKRIHELRSPIDAVVQGRRATVGSEVRLLMIAALHLLNKSIDDELGVLDDALVMRPRSGPSFPCSEDGEGIAVVMPSAIGGFRYDPKKCLYGNGTERIMDKDIVDRGDLLISRGNKRDQVGLCIVYDSNGYTTYANLLMRMQVKRDKWLPEFVKYWIMSPIAVAHIRRHTKGTSPSVQKINQRALINLPFPRYVSIERQQNWTSYLDSVFCRVEELESNIQTQYKEIQALELSLLTAAFRGDL